MKEDGFESNVGGRSTRDRLLSGEGRGAERCPVYVTRWVMGALTVSGRTGGGAGHRNWSGGEVDGSM